MTNKKGRKIGHIVSEETRRKIGDSCRGKKRPNRKRPPPFSEEHRRKLSEFCIGKKRPNLFSDEARKQISESLKKYYQAHPERIEEIRKLNIGKRIGKNNNMWKGGISSERDKIRSSVEFKLWRKSVFIRDSFTCQKYGLRNGNGKTIILHAHHINNFADFPELRTAIDNGITLSKKAHDEFHRIYGKQNNTKEQLGEFLKKDN